MHFSASLLAAGLSALVLSAPLDRHLDDECENEEFHSYHEHSAKVKTSAAHSSSVIFSSALSVPDHSLTIAPSAKTSSIFSSTTLSVPSSSSTVKLLAIASSTTRSSSAISVPTSSKNALLTIHSSSTTASAAVSAPSSSSSIVAPSASSSASGGLQWFGVNESGAEFGTAIPGVLGTDYTWPSTASIEIMMNQGMNIFRIPFLMERLAPGTMTSPLDPTYLSGLSTVVSFIAAAGGHAVIDSHNFGRYRGSTFTSTSDFQTYWTNVATEFKFNSKVIFDCNNEFHDEPSNALVVSLNQACIDGVRAAGATTQYIFVEGTSYTGAWTWTTTSGNSDSMGSLTDPYDKIVYEMHQYLDSDGSGTSATCVSSTIGAERIADATAWLKANNLKGILGEYAGGANSVCETAVKGMLDVVVAANDVWMGAMWWGGGPWWGDYIFSMEPEAGTGYVTYMDMLTKYI